MKTYFCTHTKATFDTLNNRVFFWKGCFSQWFKSPIQVSEDVIFNTAEQGMMYFKAKLFNDDEIASKILQTSNPREQKDLGRQVKGYDDSIWSEERLQVVSNVNYLKFSQDVQLKSLLILLKDWDFVEASPEDKIWGVGMAVEDPLIFDPSNWQGQNLLGKAIKIAQNRIISEL
jgi:ribA/ribD-fused uncharacterized protein